MNTMSQNVPECPNSSTSNDCVELPLPPNQQTAIALLLTGAHNGDVAAAVGIDRRTLYRWRHRDPNFARELRRQRAELLDNANDRFRYLLNSALSALELQIADPYAPTSHRAAKTLLALARIGQPMTARPRVPSPSAMRNTRKDENPDRDAAQQSLAVSRNNARPTTHEAPNLPTPPAPDYTPAQT